MPSPKANRRTEILSHSRKLLRTVGFNAFSHRDLANLVGVKSSSVHYYFPSKADIGLALVREYRDEVMSFLCMLQQLPTAQRLDRFTALFIDAAASSTEWCLAGMLASDFETLGNELQFEVRRFFHDIEDWLIMQACELCPQLPFATAQKLGKTGMAMLEGALLLSRSQGEPERVTHAVEVFKFLLVAS
jgi:TetR/AcrR family transcriptional repressor of nem operon